MERVDVEIEPWIQEDIRRALDLKLEQEQDELRKEHEELERMRFDLEVMQRLRTTADEERSKAEQRVRDLEQDLEAAKTPVPPALPAIAAPLAEADLVVPKKREPSDTPHKWAQSEQQEIPLSTLLRNYLILLAQDRRNVALALLSVVVILLSLRLASFPQAAGIAPLTDTIHTQLGKSILKDTQSHTPSSRHLLEDTDLLTRPAFSPPVAEDTRSQFAQAHDSKSIPPASVKLTGADASVESPLAPEIGPEKGSATLPYSSVSKASQRPSAHGAISSSESSNVKLN
jgi:hypothetical protein